MKKLLGADIGGTKTCVGIFSMELGPKVPVCAVVFPSKRYPDVESLLAEFLSGAGSQAVGVEAAVLGVAGPVMGNFSRLTNLPWLIDAEELRETLNLSSVLLLNDVEAMAYSIPLLESRDIATLIENERKPDGPIALIAPGTGLGEAFLTRPDSSPWAMAGVGGHADFAPADSLQAELLDYLKTRHGRVSYEQVCSGLGIFNIYGFLRQTRKFDEPKWLGERLNETKDPTPVIIEAALEKTRPCDICRAAVDIFVSILAAEAGNMALRGLTTGGVYLGGGILPKLFGLIDKQLFSNLFRNKGPMTFIVEKIPVYVIDKNDAALLGAASYGFKRL